MPPGPKHGWIFTNFLVADVSSRYLDIICSETFSNEMERHRFELRILLFTYIELRATNVESDEQSKLDKVNEQHTHQIHRIAHINPPNVWPVNPTICCLFSFLVSIFRQASLCLYWLFRQSYLGNRVVSAWTATKQTPRYYNEPFCQQRDWSTFFGFQNFEIKNHDEANSGGGDVEYQKKYGQ